MNEVAATCQFSSYTLYSAESASYGERICSSRHIRAMEMQSCGHNRTLRASTAAISCFFNRNQRIATRFGEGMSTHSARRSIITAVRREPISQAQRNSELEEEAKKIDLAPHKLLEKGEPGTMQGVIKDVIPVGYFVTLPNGRDGYLPALDLGFTGGIVILERLFKVGQELTVRVVRRGGGGREILSMKKPEFAPNTDPKFIFSERGGFGKSSGMAKGRQ